MSIIGISDEVHEAVYERLTADATLMTAVGSRVYQHVPDSTAYPYIHIGETFETKDATFEADGRSVLVWIHVWSDYTGEKEAWTITGLVGDLLDEYALTVDGGSVQSCEVEMAQVTRDPDGLRRHGKLDVRVSVAES